MSGSVWVGSCGKKTIAEGDPAGKPPTEVNKKWSVKRPPYEERLEPVGRPHTPTFPQKNIIIKSGEEAGTVVKILCLFKKLHRYFWPNTPKAHKLLASKSQQKKTIQNSTTICGESLAFWN